LKPTLTVLKAVENVYLIFSANKSGEYFGYAKMISPINEEWASKLEWKPHTEVVVDDPKLPRSIPTLATETAPRGRIIDDSARGTIFWEVESSESEEDEDKPESPEKEEVDGTGEDSSGPQTFGRPFKVEWISTARLPFYRTRGLRNPWNANRDVKIARDGTELETSVGRRLVQMFHRAVTPGASQVTSSGSPPVGGGTMVYSVMSSY
jgi:YT521-B-like domain